MATVADRARADDRGDVGGLGIAARAQRGLREGAAWQRPALAAVLALAAVVDVWSLSANGYGNAYYAAAAQAASHDWRAFFFGALDAGGFITVDKPPLSVWAMALSVRLLGLSSWSLLLPQALMGVATVGLLFATVRRSAGPLAGITAALVLALTPVAVLMFRFDDPDALLTFLLVAAAGALLRGLDTNRLRWTLLAAALVGLAFETKFLQAWLVLPAFAVTFLIGSKDPLPRRILGLLAAGLMVLVASGWWVAIVELVPLRDRPWIGGSSRGGALELLFGYDGLGRLFGGSGPGAGSGAPPGGAPGGGGFGPGSGFGFGGAPGPLRLFNERWGGQISWLLPLASIGLAAGLWLHRRADRTDRALAGYLLWGLWLMVHMVVFSAMGGIVHPYYAVALAPAVAALVGMGLVDMWAWRSRSRIGRIVLAAGIAVTAWWAAQLLGRTPQLVPGLPTVVAVTGLAVTCLLLVRWERPGRRTLGALAAAGLCLAMLAGPVAYVAETVSAAQEGADPTAGPSVPGAFGGFGVLGPFIGRGGRGAFRGVDETLERYLLDHRGEAIWLVAVDGAMLAAPLQLATGQPVMAMGGFTGTDPTPTRAALEAMLSDGRLRYVLLAGPAGLSFGGGGFGGSAVTRERDDWVRATCSAVPELQGSLGAYGSALYDCGGLAPH